MPKQSRPLADMDWISQLELSAVVRLRAKVDKIAAALDELRAALFVLESDMTDKLVAKQRVEPGKLTAQLITKLGQCRPPWREVHLKHMQDSHPEMSIGEVERLVKLEFTPPEKLLLFITGSGR